MSAPDELQKVLSCPICLETYTDPSIMYMIRGCTHVFCRDCLQSLVHNAVKTSDSRCPLCLYEFGRREVQEIPNTLKAIYTNFLALYNLQRRNQSRANGGASTDQTLSVDACQELHRQRVVDFKLKRQRILNVDENAMVAEIKEENCETNAVQSHNEGRDEPMLREDEDSVLFKDIQYDDNSKLDQGNTGDMDVVTSEFAKVTPKHVSKPATTQVPIPLPPQRFAAGDLVNVADRCWVGINEPGGVAIVTAVKEVEGVVFYDVKYQLETRRHIDVQEIFVSAAQLDLARASRRRSSPSQTSLVGSGDANTTKEVNEVSKPMATSDSNSSKMTPRGTVKDENTRNAVTVDKPEKSSGKSRGGKKVALGALGQLEAKKSSGKKKKAKQWSSSPAMTTNKLLPRCRSANIVLLTTGSNADMDEILQTFVEKFSYAKKEKDGSPSGSKIQVQLATSFDSSVTHLVGLCERNHDNVLKSRTMKFLQSMVSGVWILSEKWLADSIAKSTILDETGYEIVRTSKSKKSSAVKQARMDYCENKARMVIPRDESNDSFVALSLFKNLSIALHGQFPSPGPKKSDILYLLQRGGATLYANIQELRTAVVTPEQKKVIVVFSKEEANSTIAISGRGLFSGGSGGATMSGVGSSAASGKEEKLQDLGSEYNAKVVDYLWVLDCVTNFDATIIDEK